MASQLSSQAKHTARLARLPAGQRENQKDSTRERKGRETLTEKVRKNCKGSRRKAKVKRHTVSKQASSSPKKTLDLVPLDPCFRFLRYPGQRSHWGVADQLETRAQPGFGPVRLGLPRAGSHEHGPSCRPYAVPRTYRESRYTRRQQQRPASFGRGHFGSSAG
jgi:hypothetical protein